MGQVENRGNRQRAQTATWAAWATPSCEENGRAAAAALGAREAKCGVEDARSPASVAGNATGGERKKPLAVTVSTTAFLAQEMGRGRPFSRFRARSCKCLNP